MRRRYPTTTVECLHGTKPCKTKHGEEQSEGAKDRDADACITESARNLQSNFATITKTFQFTSYYRSQLNSSQLRTVCTFRSADKTSRNPTCKPYPRRKCKSKSVENYKTMKTVLIYQIVDTCEKMENAGRNVGT